MAVLFVMSPSKTHELTQEAMPNILRTLHNSPYYSQKRPSTTSNLSRRNDAGGGAVAMVVIVIVVVGIVVSAGLLWAYMARLTTRRRLTSGARSRAGANIWSRTPKFGSKSDSSSLRPWISRRVRRASREQEGFNRFGEEVDNIDRPTLPALPYIGLFQAASALELGEQYGLHEYTREDIREVLRPRRGNLAPGELYRNIARKVKTETTCETVRSHSGEIADIFVIGEDGEDVFEGNDPHYTFNSDDLPEQWGKKRDPNSVSPYVSVASLAVCSSCELDIRVDYTPRSSKRTSWIVKNDITQRCYRHLNDPEEALDCLICQALSTDCGSEQES